MSDKLPGSRFNLRNVRSALITILLGAITLKVALLAIMPLMPFVIGGVALLSIIGFVLRGYTR